MKVEWKAEPFSPISIRIDTEEEAETLYWALREYFESSDTCGIVWNMKCTAKGLFEAFTSFYAPLGF